MYCSTMSCSCCNFEFIHHQGIGRPTTTTEDLKYIPSTSILQMSKSLAVCLTHLYRDCVMKTRLHNIQCLADGTPPKSEEKSSH